MAQEIVFLYFQQSELLGLTKIIKTINNKYKYTEVI